MTDNGTKLALAMMENEALRQIANAANLLLKGADKLTAEAMKENGICIVSAHQLGVLRRGLEVLYMAQLGPETDTCPVCGGKAAEALNSDVIHAEACPEKRVPFRQWIESPATVENLPYPADL